MRAVEPLDALELRRDAFMAAMEQPHVVQRLAVLLAGRLAARARATSSCAAAYASRSVWVRVYPRRPRGRGGVDRASQRQRVRSLRPVSRAATRTSSVRNSPAASGQDIILGILYGRPSGVTGTRLRGLRGEALWMVLGRMPAK